MRWRLALAAWVLAAGCGSAVPGPAPLDRQNEQCRNCRMIVSDARTAAQIVAPGEEPIFFDDIGCLREYRASSPLPPDAVVYLADYRSGDWIPESNAVVTRSTSRTPMSSGLVAHARGTP